VSRLVSEVEFSDLRYFDGNAQGFRRITQLDKNMFSGGLNLTFATLAAYVKYPRLAEAASYKTGFFLTEQKIVEDLSSKLGLIRLPNGFARHPLSFLVEAADDACYGFLDLEDAVEVGVLNLHDVAKMLLQALPVADRAEYRPRSGDRSHRIIFARMRGKVFREAITSGVRTFFSNYESILKGTFDRSLLEVAAETGEGPAKVLLEAKRLVRDEVFPFDGKASIELGSYAVLACLLEEFVSAALAFSEAYERNPRNPKIDSKSAILLDMLGDHRPTTGNAPGGTDWTPYQCVRRMLDFITGMTDDFAIRVSRQLSGQIGLRAS
jgi:dGTPase